MKILYPDIIHIHNIHSHNCNLDILFAYLKSKNIKIVWTFHDCWAFTGSCTYFTFAQCEKWKSQCQKCPKSHEFSWFLDTSSKLYDRKKRLFEGIDMTIVTPSQWLAELVDESFLCHYPVEVINNGIDTNIFKPTKSAFKEIHKIKGKMLLGVGFEWGQRKGLDIFINLSKKMSTDYTIVLVGTNDEIDRQLPVNIVSIHKTQNQQELAEIYTAADIFVNPTREDNYPTVNMEALSCGTPVITFNTGGSPEMIDNSCGVVVELEDMDGLIQAIKFVTKTGTYTREACLKKALDFNQETCFRKYVGLYQRM